MFQSRSIRPFACGLWATRWWIPQGLEGPPDLRGLLEPLELLRERPVGVVADEDPVGIRVDGRREPDSAPQRAQQLQVAGGVLLSPEGGGQDRPRGVIDRGQERTRRLPGAEPGEGAPIELAEKPRLGSPGAPAPVPGRPAAAGRGAARRAEHPLDRGPAHREPLHGGELLGEVHVVESSVPPPGQGEDLGPEGLREPVTRGAAPIAVTERGRAFAAEPHPESPHLSRGHAQGFGRLPH